MRTDDDYHDSAVLESHGDEEEPQRGVQGAVARELDEPRSANRHHHRALHDSHGFHILYLQLSHPLHPCADDSHRRYDGHTDGTVEKTQEEEHRDGEDVHTQPAVERYRSTGLRTQASAL